MTATAPAPKFDHLLRLTDRRGTFEHASLAEPRPEHGYCTDDMARSSSSPPRARHRRRNQRSGRPCGAVLNEAQAFTGACRNRMDNTGRWTDEPTFEDCWGRCLWGLGTAAAHSDVSLVRRLAVIQFERAAHGRSPSPRAMAFAALGAAELLAAEPEHGAARELITDYAAGIAAPNGRRGLAVARTTTHLRERGFRRGDDRRGGCARRYDAARSAAWICWAGCSNYETADGHFSPTPVGGRGAEDITARLRPAAD